MHFAANHKRRTELRSAGEGAYPATLDNSPVIDAILAFRKDIARLLGRPHYGDCCMATKMATGDSARQPRASTAEAELRNLRAFVVARGLEGALQPWDTALHADGLREERFAPPSRRTGSRTESSPSGPKRRRARGPLLPGPLRQTRGAGR